LVHYLLLTSNIAGPYQCTQLALSCFPLTSFCTALLTAPTLTIRITMGDKTGDNAIHYTLAGSAEEYKIPNADVSTVATVIQALAGRVAPSSLFEFRDTTTTPTQTPTPTQNPTSTPGKHLYSFNYMSVIHSFILSHCREGVLQV
jgi:hypothetical protein